MGVCQIWEWAWWYERALGYVYVHEIKGKKKKKASEHDGVIEIKKR